MAITNYLSNPRLNRHSGAKPTIPEVMQSKVLEHETLMYRTEEYEGKYYNVVDVILSDNQGNILRVESHYSLID